MLTLVAAGGVFCWSFIAVIRAPDVQSVRPFHVMLLIPLLIGFIGAVATGDSAFANIRALELDLTPAETAADVVRSAWVPLRDALILTVPSFLVLMIGQIVRTRRRGTGAS
jgi:hypothetical protein